MHMEKLKHGIWVLIAIGAFLYLGPFISMPYMSSISILGIPFSYVYIFLVWVIYIFAIRWLIRFKT